MLINLTVGVKDNLFRSDSMDHCDRGVALRGVASDTSPIPPPPPLMLESPPPPPLPPPPPPPPLNAPPPPDTCPFQKFGARRRSKLRNFNWDAIPQERVQGRRSLWSEAQCAEELQIDTGRIEELFARQEESQAHCFAWRTQRTQSLLEPSMRKVSLLDPKRCMNVGIFLKQFKRSVPEIVADIRKGSGDGYCGERLAELIKHLPEKEEVKRLRAFRGDRSNLSEAELFLMLLLDVPSYTLRLEIMILKKEFPMTIVTLRSSARVLKDSAQGLSPHEGSNGSPSRTASDSRLSLHNYAKINLHLPTSTHPKILCCSELHMILRLVLKAGNFMNAGGYAGNAAGFHISSLLKLADTKANKPGMNLLHFVAMEVQSRYPDLLTFPERLEHIMSGSRLSEGAVLEDFCSLQGQVSSLELTLGAIEHQALRVQMAGFLQHAQDQLEELQKEIEALQRSRQQLLEFLCEDEDTFKLEECCQIFSTFCGKFRRAVQENKERDLEEQRRRQSECKRLEKRRSTATCSVMDDHISVDELAVTLERNLQAACKFGSIRRTKLRSPNINPARMSYLSCQGTWVRRDREKGIETLSDEENARRLRDISETVLSQQMGYGVSQENKAKSRLRFTRDTRSLDESLGPTESQRDFTTPQPTGATTPSATPDWGTAVVDNHLLIVNIQKQSESSSSSSPAQNMSVAAVITQQSSFGPSCTSSEANTYTQTRSIPAKAKAGSQNSAVNITAQDESNNPPSAGNTPARPVDSNKPPTGYMRSRAAVNTPTSPTGSLSARPEVPNGPPDGNIPATPEIRYQPASRPMPTKLEINKGLSTVPAGSEVSNQMQIGNMTARPEVNNQQSNVHMLVRHEIINEPSSECISARLEINKQTSTGSKPTQPETNNQTLIKSIQAKTTISKQPSTESISARAEVKKKLFTGNITAKPKINNQTSNGSISAISEVNTEPSTRSIPSNREITNHPSVGNISASLEIIHPPTAACAPNPGPVLTRSLAYRPLTYGPTLPEFPRVGETVECRSLVKGLKSYENLTVQKAPPSPCAKWKREQLNILEGGEGQQCSTQRTSERIRALMCTDRNQRSKDLPKDSEPGGYRNGSARTGKQSPTEGAIRRVQSAREKSLVTASIQEVKKPKPSSSSFEPSSSSQGVRTIPLIRRTTLPRTVQSKARVTTATEELKDPSSVTRKEAQESGTGKVRELDKSKGQTFTIRPALASPRKPLTRSDAIRYPRDTGTSFVAHRGPTSPRPGSVSPSHGATTPPVSPRGQMSFRLKPAEVQQGRSPSPVSPGFLTPPRNPLSSPKKTRAVTPPAAKVVKHCSPISTADPSQAERSRWTGSQPIWR